MRYRIDATIPHGPAVKEFRLAPAGGAPLPAWQAGAHVELRFHARSGASHTNAYSIVGEIDGQLRIAVQREERGRGGSRALHDEFEPGMELEAGMPLASFRLQPGSTRTVLIAGGIGITPLLPMARVLEAAGARYELHYLAREPQRLVLAGDWQALDQARVRTYVTGEKGRPDLARMIGPWREGSALHACGPVALLEAVRDAAVAQGWPWQHIHFESFGMRLQPQDLPVRVHLRQTGMTLDVAPGRSILDAMIDAGVFVAYECKRGECGNCYASVVAGEPAHRDLCLNRAQRAQGMTPCVSWASTPELELDL
jgi:vanillate O-demethylase ferredoxin subunit